MLGVPSLPSFATRLCRGDRAASALGFDDVRAGGAGGDETDGTEDDGCAGEDSEAEEDADGFGRARYSAVLCLPSVAFGSCAGWRAGSSCLTFEKGRKAGVSSSSSSSSAEDSCGKAALPLALGEEKRGRRANARLWEIGCASEDDDEELRSALGESGSSSGF